MTHDIDDVSIAIVTPVFNDWVALRLLLAELSRLSFPKRFTVRAIVVDDCSSQRVEGHSLVAEKGNLVDISLIRLSCNLGPMRAIAVGLVAAHEAKVDAVIVMDADGEDQPADVIRLLNAWAETPDHIVVAERAERSEGTAFKVFYAIYKRMFELMSGQSISFGSFSILPRNALQALVHNPAVWSNLPVAITRSRLPYRPIPTKRGARLAGKSGMNFSNLAIHGGTGISIYADVALLRIVLVTGTLAILLILGVICSDLIHFEAPTWLALVTASLIVVLLQSLVCAGIGLLQVLTQRTLRGFVPATDAKAFIVSVESIFAIQ